MALLDDTSGRGCFENTLFCSHYRAVCMRNPLYDVIIGNVPGARDTVATSDALINHEVSSVFTCQQEQRAQKQVKPLKLPMQ